MQQREQIAVKLTLICMARKHLLGIASIDGDFSLTGVVARATKRAVESHLSTGSLNIERHATLGRRIL